MLVLNIFPPKHKQEPVEVVYLDTLSKTQLLRRWEESLSYPHRYFVCEVESVKRLVEAETKAGDLITLGQYLDEYNISVDIGDYHKLATRVSQAYSQLYGVRPRRVLRKNDQGEFTNRSYGYDVRDLAIIEECLLTVPHSRKPK